MSESEPYHQYAEECRKLAATMKDPAHRKHLQDMAEAWTLVAKEKARKTASKVQSEARQVSG